MTTLEMRAGITCAIPFRSLYPIYRDGELCAFLGSLAGYGLPWELCPIKLALTPNAGWEGCMPNTDAQAGARFLNVKKRHIASAVSVDIIKSQSQWFPGRCALLAAKAESVLKLAEDLQSDRVACQTAAREWLAKAGLVEIIQRRDMTNLAREALSEAVIFFRQRAIALDPSILPLHPEPDQSFRERILAVPTGPYRMAINTAIGKALNDFGLTYGLIRYPGAK